MINIEEDNLKNVIKKNSKYIIKRKVPVESIIGLCIYIFSIFIADLRDKPLLSVFAYTVLAGYIVYVGYQITKCILTKFSDEVLFDQIMGVVEKAHSFSLCVIKSDDKYLMKYDKRWKCYLFPYFRTKIDNDEESISSNVLKLTGINKGPDKIVESIDKKYSYSDGYEKKYNHTYYNYNIDLSKSSLPNDESFKIDGIKYKWFTIDELRNDKVIMKKNGTIISFAEQNF